MLNVRRHNPILLNRLNALIASADYADCIRFLDKLSVADFRTAGILLAENILPQLPAEDFWECFSAIVKSNSKAYLMTFLKAALKSEAIKHTGNATFRSYLMHNASNIDKRKIRETLLPHVCNEKDFHELLSLCSDDVPAERIDCLMKIGTPTAYFLLFCEARRIEDDTNALRTCCLQLMKKGDKISFNLACILQQYFAIGNLPGTFSLHLETYELGRLTDSFDRFKSILMK